MRAPVGHFRRLATLQAKGLILVSAGVVLLMATLSARPFSDRPMSAGPSRTVADFSLLDQDGRMHQLSRYAGSRAVVLFVPGVGCNVARALDIRRAGEAIVIDTRTWQVAYRGRVDDGLGVTGSG